MGDGETARELLAAAVEQEVRDGGADRAVRLYLESRTVAPRLQLSGEAYYRLAGWLARVGGETLGRRLDLHLVALKECAERLEQSVAVASR